MIKTIQYFAALFVLVIIIILAGSTKIRKESSPLYFLEGDTLDVRIAVEGGVYIRQGHPSGFHYDILNKFAKNEKCKLNLLPKNDSDKWDELISGSVDILVIDADKEVIPDELSGNLISSVAINDGEQVWVVRREDFNLLQQLNYWINFFKQSMEYGALITKYFKRYTRIPFSMSASTSVLSPYDDLIKKYSKTIGWDWRLLASLIYQESKFSMNVSSSRGAHGLMQVKAATAKQFNIDNVFDPEQNIKAGTLLIKRLQKMFDDPGIDSVNRIKIVLAAYNSGEGRVIDMRSLARHNGVDPNDWNILKDLIPQMRKRENIPPGVLKLGPFKGHETFKFVDEVYDRYITYTNFVKK